jgi:hypothetical protein
MAKVSNQFSISKDCTIQLVTNLGSIQLPKLTGFHAEPIFETPKSKVMDGPTIQMDIPDGWNITIKFDRVDNDIDAFFSLAEATYHATGIVLTGTILQFIVERSGGLTTYQFQECSIKWKSGDWKAGSPISYEIDAYARFRKSV